MHNYAPTAPTDLVNKPSSRFIILNGHKMNFSASQEYATYDGRYLQHESVKRCIHKLPFSPDDDLFDVGCGTGEETKTMAAKVRSVVGIDASQEMLDVARKVNSGPNVTYCIGDARTVGDNPEWRERFDKLTCFHVFHWFLEHAQALGSILSCLKPGGEALFQIGNINEAIVEVAKFLATHAKWSQYLKGYKQNLYPLNRTIPEIVDLFSSCGWINVQCDPVSTQSSSETHTKLLMKTCLGQTAYIPEAEHEAYLEDLWQWAFSMYKDTSLEGNVQLPIEDVVIHAYKPS